MLAETIFTKYEITHRLLISIFSLNSYSQTKQKLHRMKIFIARVDSSIWLSARKDYEQRIFGYQSPDTTSKKMILFSLYKKDVEENQFNCPYGVYYQTNEMKGMTLKYASDEAPFVGVNIFKSNILIDTFYILREWMVDVQ
jgi:hypothetical protein